VDTNLKGRVAVVTGGGSGIGESIARALAAEGCKLCILDRDASGRSYKRLVSNSANAPEKGLSAAMLVSMGCPVALKLALLAFTARKTP